MNDLMFYKIILWQGSIRPNKIHSFVTPNQMTREKAIELAETLLPRWKSANSYTVTPYQT